ncbi:hypothetical protein J3E69DRAFT_321040 [Trichoderma sp. SZMC 28015]
MMKRSPFIEIIVVACLYDVLYLNIPNLLINFLYESRLVNCSEGSSNVIILARSIHVVQVGLVHLLGAAQVLLIYQLHSSRR